jgi:hypothetical protein
VHRDAVEKSLSKAELARVKDQLRAMTPETVQ